LRTGDGREAARNSQCSRRWRQVSWLAIAAR
jgi:hypothetical protein